jgi:hypothetical protein
MQRSLIYTSRNSAVRKFLFNELAGFRPKHFSQFGRNIQPSKICFGEMFGRLKFLVEILGDFQLCGFGRFSNEFRPKKNYCVMQKKKLEQKCLGLKQIRVTKNQNQNDTHLHFLP